MPSVPHVNVYPLRARRRTRRLCLAVGIPLSMFASYATAVLESDREQRFSRTDSDLRFLHWLASRGEEVSPCNTPPGIVSATTKGRPTQDPWGGLYRAECLDPNGADIRICTAGPDRRFDTTDDLCFDGR